MPFQFSCHILNDCGSQPENINFLADGTDDPRVEFLESLKKALGYEEMENGREANDGQGLSVWDENPNKDLRNNPNNNLDKNLNIGPDKNLI